MRSLDVERSQPPPGSLLGFFSLTFALTWACFIAVMGMSGKRTPVDLLRPEFRTWILYLGVFAPSLVALGLTARAEGGSGVRALLRRLVRYRVGARWYAFAVTYTVTIKLAAALVHRLLTGTWPRFGSEAWPVMVAATVFSTVIGGQAGEEIGWRGYALPRLAIRFGLARASLVLGVIWALWHLPLFYLPGTDTYGQSFPVYVLQVTALSVAFAWLYWRTQGSLLLTMLMHAAVNNTTVIVPSTVESATNPLTLNASLMAWLATAWLWVAAGIFLVRMSKADLIADLRASDSG